MHAESKINKPHVSANFIYFIAGSYGVTLKGFFIILRKVSRESKEKLLTLGQPFPFSIRQGHVVEHLLHIIRYEF
jgi:hypothetical protein